MAHRCIQNFLCQPTPPWDPNGRRSALAFPILQRIWDGKEEIGDILGQEKGTTMGSREGEREIGLGRPVMPDPNLAAWAAGSSLWLLLFTQA